MNKIKSLLLAVLVVGMGYSLRADVSTNTVPFGGNGSVTNLTQQNFIENLAVWVTTRYDSGLTWPTNDTDIEVGADYGSQTAWANYIALTKNINSFYVGGQMDNSGVGGTIDSLSGRAGYTLSNAGDLRVKAGLAGGYKLHDDGFAPKGGFVQPELGAEKLITGPTAARPTAAVTFADAWIYYPIRFHGQQASAPGFKLAGGFTF